MMNSSTCPESRKAATSSAPPTSQMSLPFSERSRSANAVTSSLTTLTLGLAAFGQRARENVILLLRVPSSHSKAHREVVGFAPRNAGVDGTIEFGHTVVTLRVWTVKPLHRAVSTCDEAISTGGDVDDELALSIRPRHAEKDIIPKSRRSAKSCFYTGTSGKQFLKLSSMSLPM